MDIHCNHDSCIVVHEKFDCHNVVGNEFDDKVFDEIASNCYVVDNFVGNYSEGAFKYSMFEVDSLILQS